MTDREIMKALECCCEKGLLCESCDECPNLTMGSLCMDQMLRDAINLIHRQKADIERLEIELKAMRGAANSFKADVKKLQEVEAKRLQEMVTPLVIRNNKISAQELAEMIKFGVISTNIEDAEIERLEVEKDRKSVV